MVVNLSATGADSDGTIASYSWQQDSGVVVTITGADMANASFVAPTDTGCEALNFRVTVTDDDGATGSDTVAITVNDSTQPPPPTAGNFIPLGDLPGGDFSSEAYGVSADGSVVVGVANVSCDPNAAAEAFHWTAATGMVGLGDLLGGGGVSVAEGVSANGEVVVGWSQTAMGTEAFRWTVGTGMVGLGGLPGVDLASGASSASDDGSVIVGTADTGVNEHSAFRWTAGTGMVGLGDFPGGGTRSGASDTSADGGVVVGSSISASGLEAFRWAAGTGMVGLGDLPDGSFASSAHGVSADGSVIVGIGESTIGREAFVWTQTDGMRSLRDVLLANGATGFDNWQLKQADAISADGRWVVGWGFNASGDREAFLANISPSP
jgi:probable HAF family extracellular repeat protein